MEIVDPKPSPKISIHQFTSKPLAVSKGLILSAYRTDSFLIYPFSVPNHLFRTDLAELFQKSNLETSHKMNLLLPYYYLTY